MSGGQPRSPISSFITHRITTSPSSPLFCRCLQLPANLPLILAQFLINMFTPPPKTKVTENLSKSEHTAVSFSSAVPLNNVLIYWCQCKSIATQRGKWGVSLGDRCRLPGGFSLWISWFIVRRCKFSIALSQNAMNLPGNWTLFSPYIISGFPH